MELQTQIYIIIGVFAFVLVFLINLVFTNFYKIRKLSTEIEELYSRYLKDISNAAPVPTVSAPVMPPVARVEDDWKRNSQNAEQILPRVKRASELQPYYPEYQSRQSPRPPTSVHSDFNNPGYVEDYNNHRRSQMPPKGYPLPTKSVMNRMKIRSSFNDNAFADQHNQQARSNINQQIRSQY